MDSCLFPQDKTKEFQLVNEAYAVLSKPSLRAAYDASYSRRSKGVEVSNGATYRGQEHPYAAQSTVPVGINEEVWYAHHYGGSAHHHVQQPLTPEYMFAAELDSIQRCVMLYFLSSMTPHFWVDNDNATN